MVIPRSRTMICPQSVTLDNLILTIIAVYIITITLVAAIAASLIAGEITISFLSLAVVFAFTSFYILPFGLAGAGVGYFIQKDRNKKLHYARTGFILGFASAAVALMTILLLQPPPIGSTPWNWLLLVGELAGIFVGILVASFTTRNRVQGSIDNNSQ